MKIISLNIGLPRTLNLEGDRRADLSVHGGNHERRRPDATTQPAIDDFAGNSR